jgi:cyanate lyase
MFSKLDATEEILVSKFQKKLNWETIAEYIGMSEVWTTSACLGQNSMKRDTAIKLGECLGLSEDAVQSLQQYPLKGTGSATPTDPLLYRFFEICYVYGPTIKEIINEKFGDGIMSAIDFSMDIEKVEDPKGDRVKIVMNGKFLPYKTW